MDQTAKSNTQNKHHYELTAADQTRQSDIVKQVREGEYEPVLSILQQEYQAKALQRQKEGITKPQIVAGREFKGTSFISKPETIFFKDFTVGVSHSQTILVTNVSFSFNSFKLMPLEDKIKDFFHIVYTPTGRMSAGLSTTIQITFTPQLNVDINSYFPILSETGVIKIPLVCTCKKALISVVENEIDFGNVIFGEQCTRQLKLNNTGALATKIYVKTNDGRTIPFFNMDDLRKREDLQLQWKEHVIQKNRKKVEKEKAAEEKARLAAEAAANAEEGAEPSKEEPVEEPVEEEEVDPADDFYARIASLSQEEIEFEEFLAQVQFKRTTEINGYSDAKIEMTFIPYKLTRAYQDFTLFFENQDYTEPIPISIKGQCVDVPIYVEKEEYNLNILIYEQIYRQKVILFNRSSNSMKIQLFFPKDFKPYLEFNPTLGYIQGNSLFEIWLKFRPDRSILQTCSKFLVKKNSEEEPKDEFEEFTMRIPIKVTGANQVLPVNFDIMCCFSVNAITFSPPSIDFGNVFNQMAAKVDILMENHSLLPQQFSFVRLPKEISITTDAGTGDILPGEKYKLTVEYRPTQQVVQDESVIYVRMITGKICARELKINYVANVSKCPLVADKRKIEFPCLPETEFNEVVLQLSNVSQKEYMIEICPPNSKLSGIVVNPLVKNIAAGQSTLVSLKYNSLFRDLTHASLENAKKGTADDLAVGQPAGMVSKNKKIEAFLKSRKEQAADSAPAADKKGDKKAPPKKEDPPKKDDKKGAKGGPTQEEEEAEAERIKGEEAEKERLRVEAIEKAFNKEGQLEVLGGDVDDFFVEDPNRRSQHYKWLIPIFYKPVDGKTQTEVMSTFIEARTTTVKRTLIPNEDVLEFGEIPVAFKQTHEILIKNVGITSETLRMEALTPFGGFSVLNAMRTLKPGETKPVVIQFEPLAQQIYEERIVIYSGTTMVSVNLKGTGVRPEVNIQPEDGIISFNNALVGETVEKQFEITNVSSFSVNFTLQSQAAGVDNLSKQRPFLLIPSQGMIAAKSSYMVNIVFQPDHESDNYFDVLLIDIPNQINAKKVYLRGWAYTRQFFAREYVPFIWQPSESLIRKYEEPLKMLMPAGASPASGQEQKQKIFLTFARDEDIINIDENDEFERIKNRKRQILLGNCRLLDQKLEKPGNFEINPPSGASDKYFECDNLKGTVTGGQEQLISFSFTPPQADELLSGINALKGIGQWVESVWEMKLIGGFVEPGQPDPVTCDVILRAYVEQI